MKTFEGGINDDGRNIRMLSLAMVLILLIQVQMLACFLIVRDQFLKTGIVHLSRGSQHFHQGLFLSSVGAHPVLKRSHAQILARFDS